MRFILRLAVLALGAYGAWMLYENYGERVRSTRGSFDEFAARAKRSTTEAADKVHSAAGDATDAIAASAADIKDAAAHTQESVTETLRDAPAVTAKPSS